MTTRRPRLPGARSASLRLGRSRVNSRSPCPAPARGSPRQVALYRQPSGSSEPDSLKWWGSETMSLKADLAKLLKALPAGTPFGAGAGWSDYWSQVSAEEVRQLLVKADLSREEMLALLGQQHALILESVQEIADESQQREVQAL